MSLERCEYRPAASDAEREAYVRALCLAFAAKPEDVREWLARAGHDLVRVLVGPSGEVRAGLLLMPAGLFFGGRSVPMWGVAGVAVPPEARGAGAALALMRRCVLEMHERGVPLSALYPATQTLYRRAGYEQAGILPELRVNPKLIRAERTDDLSPPGADAPVTVRALEDADLPAVRALSARVSRDADGRLDRGEYVWNRIKNPRDATATGFVLCAPAAGGGRGAIEGYVYLSLKRNDTGRHDATLTDAVCSTPRAGRRMLAFLADLRSMCESITWRASPGDPLLLLMQEHPYQMRVRELWMLRVIDVRRALEQRGYAPGVSGSITVSVRDGVIPANTGAWRLRVADGRASVERLPAAPADAPRERAIAPAHAALETTERGLAALYSGFASAHALRDAGLALGDDESCDIASALFAPSRGRAGLAPSMPDFF